VRHWSPTASLRTRGELRTNPLHEFARGASATLCRPLSGLPSKTRVFRYFAEACNICGVEDISKVDTSPFDAALMPHPSPTLLTSLNPELMAQAFWSRASLYCSPPIVSPLRALNFSLSSHVSP
jgi:hypothetical protein